MKHSVSILFIFCAVFFCTSCLSLPFGKKTVDDDNLSVQELILAGRFAEAKNMFSTKTDINEKDAEGNTALHAAAKVGDADLITYLLIKDADSTLKNDDGDTPLLVAMKNSKYAAAHVLAETGTSLYIADADGKTPLDLTAEYNTDEWYDAIITSKTGTLVDSNGQTMVHYFVKQQLAEAVNKCIQKKIPLSVEDNNGKTPLALALANAKDEKNVTIAASLIMAKCEPLRGIFSYFEDAVLTRNMSLRFDDNQTPLHIAASQGQSGIVKYLLANGASTTAQDNTGSTPLHEAVRYGQTDIVKILLNSGAKVNARDSLGKTPLLLIIPKESQAAIYTVLLMRKADANAKDLYGDTPLHIATMDSVDVRILQKLVDAGADINERNKGGVTPLALAVEHNLKDHILFYANLGADINAEDKQHDTPLTRSFAQNLDSLKMLVNKNNITSRDSAGNTPLHLAIAYKANMDYIRYLLECGADIDARNSNGDSVLYLAVQNNAREIGEILINKGANVYATNTSNYSPLRLALTNGGEVQDWVLGSSVISGDDGNGNTPLHYAAEWKLDDAVQYLIHKGADVNKKNANGETPLFNAVKADSPTTVKLLVSKGANPDTRDLLGNTPLHYAVRWNALHAATQLLTDGCAIDSKNASGKTALSDAARSGAKAMVTLLLSKGAFINASDATGKTVLTDAVQSEYADMVQLLLSNGASVNIQDMYGRNSYHEAADIGDTKIIKLLLSAGGNPLSRDSFGKTPFSLAITKGTAVIQAVLGDNMTLVDSDGNNPLHAAVASRASADIMQFLINKGYPIDQRNGQGLSPLEYAIIQNQHILAKILLKNNADPFITDNSGECAVTNAFKQGNEDILTDMVKTAGIRTDLQGDTMLHYAARTADAATVKTLLDLGLDRSRRNTAGETPYDIAKRWKRMDIAQLLL
jgi:ankyrin repeat protein